jgi:uncharacterized membrane protein
MPVILIALAIATGLVVWFLIGFASVLVVDWLSTGFDKFDKPGFAVFWWVVFWPIFWIIVLLGCTYDLPRAFAHFYDRITRGS